MTKPAVGVRFPDLTLPKFGGGTLDLGGKSDRWVLLVVYRGKHCGRCKPYLTQLSEMRPDWEAAGFEIAVISADPEAKVAADMQEFGWNLDIGMDLSVDQMRLLGLYVSDPLTPDETDRQFAEPALFCITPDGLTQVAAISNAPSCRPDLVQLLDGMIFTIKHGKPARGTA